jgi:DNA gyrase subunit A
VATTTKRRKKASTKSDYTPLITDEEIAAEVKKVTARWFLENKDLDYAIYANTSRALPLAASGVKLGAQRLLVSMLRDGVKPGTKPRKSAKLTSSATGGYHPHASTAMYGTLATQASTFGRVQTVEGIGSFGMAPGDEPAADRYTEARLSELGYAMVQEVASGAVPTKRTYDNETTEPLYLPVPVPVLLCAGADGIGFGWATSTPAHNPREVIAATLAYLDDPTVSVDRLMEIMPGPDWGTGGAVVGGTDGIRSYYESGQGKLKVRGTWHTEGRDIVITEVPPGISVPTLLDGKKTGDNPRPGLRDLVRQGVIEGVADVNDFTGRKEGLRLVITTKRGADIEEVVTSLLRETALECTYGANVVALRRDLAPDWWSLRDLLSDFISLRDQVVRFRSEHRLSVLSTMIARAAAIAAVTLDKDTTVKLITAAEDKADAAAAVADHFELTGEQGVWIVEMPLHRLTKADTLEAQKRLEKLQDEQTELNRLLSDEDARREVIRAELIEARHLFDDPVYDRRTKITPEVEPVSGAGAEESDQDRLMRWRLDPDAHSLGETGEEIHNAHAVWTAFTDGKIKRFGGGGLPKRITVKPVAPDYSRIHSCGLYTPEVQHLLLVTAGTNKADAAKVLRVDTAGMRAQGISGNGVAGIKLLDGDTLVGCFPVTDDDQLLVATDTGFKVVKVSDIPVKGTGAQGVGVFKRRKGESGVLMAQVAPGFTVNGKPAKPVGVQTAGGRTPLDSWEAAQVAG